MAATVTATFLFTDLVGSTALSSSLAATEADALRQIHFGLLREAVTATGGAEVKNLGDGLMVSFGRSVGVTGRFGGELARQRRAW